MTIAYSTSHTSEGTSQSTVRGREGALRQAYRQSNKALWGGRIVSGLVSALLLMDATMKVLHAPEAVTGTTDLGYPESIVGVLGVVQLVCLATYLVPRTAVLGAVLWTGYLGGAIASHARLGDPLFSHVLFPIYVAAFLWLGLWLRDARVRALLQSRA